MSGRLEILKDYGVEIVGYFMVDPAYTEDDFQRLLEHVQELEIDTTNLFNFNSFPRHSIVRRRKR